MWHISRIEFIYFFHCSSLPPPPQPACQLAYDGNVHQLYQLLMTDPSQLNVQEKSSGDTPLIAACRRGKVKAVEYLLENGADVHLTNQVVLRAADAAGLSKVWSGGNCVSICVSQKQRTCLHYVSKRTSSLLDYLMVAILMPILLLGYFLMVKQTGAGVLKLLD